MISSLCLSMIFSENRFPLFPDHAVDAGIDLHSGVLGNSEVAVLLCNAAEPVSASFPRDGNHIFAATTTRPGTGVLSSLRADSTSSCDNLRPAASIEARTQGVPSA